MSEAMPRPRKTPALVATCPRMRAALDRIDRFAASDAHVAIAGETGTGKELAARRLHARSKRAGEPFVPLNCAAIPETSFESELFGHERGAFTSAVSRRRGLFALADGGTIFLDEIAELPLFQQAKLPRVLEEGEVAPVGGEKLVPVDVRVVAATNRDLRGAVEAGGFREDQYHRLAVLTMELPPLRERGDLDALVEHFVRLHAREEGWPVPSVAAPARAWLHAHRWPGKWQWGEAPADSGGMVGCAGA